jgi:allatostatin receptor
MHAPAVKSHRNNNNMRIKHICQMFQIFFFLTSYAIPLAIICILYVLMLMRLWKGVNPGGQPPSAESRRGKKRVTRMVVVVVAIFAFCWFPIQVSYGFNNYGIYHSIIIQFNSMDRPMKGN